MLRLPMFSGLCLILAVSGCGQPTAKIEVRSGDGVATANGIGFLVKRDGNAAEFKSGRLTVNGKSYGVIKDGATIIVEEDGRVLVNGVERQPE